MLLRLRSVLLLSSMIAGACSADSRPPPVGHGAGAAPAPSDAGPGLLQINADARELQDDQACVSETQQAEAVPLALIVMLDASGSMLDPTASGATKWDAVQSALGDFVRDPESAGISVGLGFFPLAKPGVPIACQNDAECGPGGPCGRPHACDAGDTVQICQADADCGPGVACVEFGACESAPDFACTFIGSECSDGVTSYGTCVALAPFCTTRDSCESQDYATPELPIAPLPAAADPFLAAVRRRTPDGLTPTGPALSGALEQAATYASTHPGHSVVTLLATDGFPTECDPMDVGAISQLAAGAAMGEHAIRTFVIGVFADDEPDAPANLNRIALAGGTGTAFMVDAGGNVAGGFGEALAAIRGAVLSCEFQLPNVAELDLGRVNLDAAASAGAEERLVNVGTAAGCAGTEAPGWFYDVDPASGGVPTKLSLCPEDCARLRADRGSLIDVKIGCATREIR